MDDKRRTLAINGGGPKIQEVSKSQCLVSARHSGRERQVYALRNVHMACYFHLEVWTHFESK